MKDFFYVGPATAPTGIVGVQIHGADALLRSLVVSICASHARGSDKCWLSARSNMPASTELRPSTC